MDDDTSMREAMTSLLRSYAFEVIAFAGAHDVLAHDGLADVACLVCDVQMPAMTGLELQDRLAQTSLAIRVIFVTAAPNAADRRRALAAGALAYLEKPVRSAELVGYVSQAFGSPASVAGS